MLSRCCDRDIYHCNSRGNWFTYLLAYFLQREASTPSRAELSGIERIRDVLVDRRECSLEAIDQLNKVHRFSRGSHFVCSIALDIVREIIRTRDTFVLQNLLSFPGRFPRTSFREFAPDVPQNKIARLQSKRLRLQFCFKKTKCFLLFSTPKKKLKEHLIKHSQKYFDKLCVQEIL